MMRRRWLPIVALVASTAGCFHQVVQTGRPAGSNVIDMPWVSGWLWGLVAPPPIETRSQCPSGVATVETEMSFMNGLVSALTLGIYSPQHVRITCSSGGTASLPRGLKEFSIPANATAEQRADVLSRAIEASANEHAPVILRF
jgi:hypothetical protein